jgi:type I restriction enzyme M protein
MDISQSQIVSFIWSIADDCLRDVFQRGQYRDVILPMVVLRRFDALLEPTKKQVDEEIERQRREYDLGDKLDTEAIDEITGLNYFNTSKWTLQLIYKQATNDKDTLLSNFREYLNGYSENVKDVLRNFEFDSKARKLADNGRLLPVIEKVIDPRINLTDREVPGPDGIMLPALSNIAMGTVFEELLRRFNEENNEDTGAHFTPRDAIRLLARLVFEPVKDNLPPIIMLYDPAAGTGGMLTESRDYLLKQGVPPEAIKLYGTEINSETYAICKADLILKGVDPKGIHLGNTLTEDHFAGTTFGYCITNPPYGKSWKNDRERIYSCGELTDHRYCLPLRNFRGETNDEDCTPRNSDGQLLFTLEEVNKMTPPQHQKQGSRIASVHNGSSLFTGNAGQGESNIRRYLVENDLVDCIVQLPNNIFYNTGIATYVWVLANRKPEERRGRVLLIDASRAYERLRKNQGFRNCTITPRHAEQIVQAYMAFRNQAATDECPVESKVFRGDDFRYYAVTVERPLRLRCQFSAEKAQDLLYDAKDPGLSRWLYARYGERMMQGIAAEMPAVKEYLQQQEVNKTDSQLAALTSPAKWAERHALMQAALALVQAVGTEPCCDFGKFCSDAARAAKARGLKLTAAQLKTICRAMAVTDPAAQPVVKKTFKAGAPEIAELTGTFGVSPDRLAHYGFIPQGKQWVQYEPDTALRDTEKVPATEDIYAYFQREVLPYVPDAWIDLPQTQIGCKIQFNKYFYHPQPLRSLAENEADIRKLNDESKGIIDAILGAE